MIKRFGNCTECQLKILAQSKYLWIAEFKFIIKLFKHYRKEHNKNIFIELLKYKFIKEGDPKCK
jgi:hypothetical protein